MWRMACRNISVLLVVTSIVLAVSGLLCIDVTALTNPNKFYPICMPWWDNEIGTDVTWFKIVAGLFSVAPGAAIFVSLFVLAYRVNKFKALIRTGVGALNHYTALYIEIKANQHLKFVRTVFWLGTLFIIASSPVGMFIIIGPYIRAMGDYVEVNHHAQANLTDRKPPPRGVSPPSYYTSTYMSISRSDLEVTIWLIYYTFAIFVVPVLLYTEILFYREWSGRMRKLANFLCCRKPQAPRWPNIDALENDENASKLAGPYVACSDGADETLGRLKTSNEAKLTKIFDAGNAIRAGRDVKQMLPMYSRQMVRSDLARQAHVASMFAGTTPGCKTPKEPAAPKRDNMKSAPNKGHGRPHVVKSADSSTT
ncbi:unnamed protein product [Lymnaea stagnalis]|uniref:Uncharacterized protein n=1 Tax=Lymnaea stagnalis TaxID=6523 RepID=A0AAV2HMS4_LYMST